MFDPRKKSLYFHAGPVPSVEERAEAAELGIVAFRNASVIEPGTRLESAAFVAGCAPERYQLMKGTTVIPPKAQAKDETKADSKEPAREPHKSKAK